MLHTAGSDAPTSASGNSFNTMLKPVLEELKEIKVVSLATLSHIERAESIARGIYSYVLAVSNSIVLEPISAVAKTAVDWSRGYRQSKMLCRAALTSGAICGRALLRVLL